MPRISREPQFEEPYGSLLSGVLGFRTLADTERTLTRLEQLRLFFLKADDKKGVGYCRKLALLGRRRAEAIARNPKISCTNRLQKAESAEWFRIWLEMPEGFATWLALRKATEECSLLYGATPSAVNSD